jgi:hypothetical protein
MSLRKKPRSGTANSPKEKRLKALSQHRKKSGQREA